MCNALQLNSTHCCPLIRLSQQRAYLAVPIIRQDKEYYHHRLTGQSCWRATNLPDGWALGSSSFGQGSMGSEKKLLMGRARVRAAAAAAETNSSISNGRGSDSAVGSMAAVTGPDAAAMVKLKYFHVATGRYVSLLRMSCTVCPFGFVFQWP